jgi:hypothetical protein
MDNGSGKGRFMLSIDMLLKFNASLSKGELFVPIEA